jgi:hypothetical protein
MTPRWRDSCARNDLRYCHSHGSLSGLSYGSGNGSGYGKNYDSSYGTGSGLSRVRRSCTRNGASYSPRTGSGYRYNIDGGNGHCCGQSYDYSYARRDSAGQGFNQDFGKCVRPSPPLCNDQPRQSSASNGGWTFSALTWLETRQASRFCRSPIPVPQPWPRHRFDTSSH